jgi:ribose/xylose/arabinose/galactoside ABC-type transport system permease subunit
MNEIAASGAPARTKIREFLSRFGSVLGILLVLIIFQLIDNRFMRMKNIVGVLNSSTLLIIMSVASMLVMSVRGIDLSVAQVADMSGVIVAMTILSGKPFWVGIIAALLFGLLVGVINSILMSYLGIPAIIGTLGIMFVIRSIELTLTNGAQPQILFTLPPKRVKDFFFIGQGSLGPVPMLVIICLVVVVIMYFVKERSVLGRHMEAVQGNVRASFLSSINIRKVFGATFILSSVLSAIAGIMLLARSGNAQPRGVESYLTDCFVAVYIGNLVSGSNKFTVVGTVIGALFVGFLSNFFTLMGMGPDYKNLFNGLFIIGAVTLGSLQRRKNR